jgi:hypothetical protein
MFYELENNFKETEKREIGFSVTTTYVHAECFKSLELGRRMNVINIRFFWEVMLRNLP